MRQERLTTEKNEFAAAIGQAVVAEAINDPYNRVDRGDICTVGREGAKRGAQLAIEVLRRVGVLDRIERDDMEKAINIAKEFSEQKG